MIEWLHRVATPPQAEHLRPLAQFFAKQAVSPTTESAACSIVG
jgi:hypothetical protein